MVGRLLVGRLLPLDCHSTECDGGIIVVEGDELSPGGSLGGDCVNEGGAADADLEVHVVEAEFRA